MILLVLLSQAIIGWCILTVLLPSKREKAITQSFTVGSTLSFLVFWFSWLIGLTWEKYVAAHFVIVSICLGITVYRYRQIRMTDASLFLRRLRGKAKSLVQKTPPALTFPHWPLIWMGGIAIVSFAILSLWNGTVQAVHWDSLSLYSYRGAFIAENGTFEQLKTVRLQHENLLFYDRLHPFLLSYYSAWSNWSHWPFEQIWQWVLSISMLAMAWQQWRSVRKFIVFTFLLFTLESSFTGFIEGYGGMISGIFWLLFWFELARKDAHWVIASLFLAGSMSARLAEPFWLIGLGLGIWQWRQAYQRAIQFSVIPLLTYLSWQYFVQTWDRSPAAALETVGPATAIITQGFQLSILPETLRLWLESEATLLLFLVAVSSWVLRPKMFGILPLLLTFLLTGHAILLTGMSYLAMTSPSAWVDIQTALPRAAYPLTLAAIVWLTDILKEKNHGQRTTT